MHPHAQVPYRDEWVSERVLRIACANLMVRHEHARRNGGPLHAWRVVVVALWCQQDLAEASLQHTHHESISHK